jgi:hypothetical protein
MTLLSRGVRFLVVSAIVGVGGAAVGSLSRHATEVHRSLLPASVTVTNGASRAITLTGVGCNIRMCSRTAIRSGKEETWLDDLGSVTDIVAKDSGGPVKVLFHFKNGKERETYIGAGSRVLYLKGPFGSTEKLDLGSVYKIDF